MILFFYKQLLYYAKNTNKIEFWRKLKTINAPEIQKKYRFGAL
jgi:hypothetical protein